MSKTEEGKETGKETEADLNKELAGFGSIDLFETDKLDDEYEEEINDRISDFKDVREEPEEVEDLEAKKDEEVDEFNFEGTTKEEEIDLESFNKKFGQNFQSEKEMKEHFKKEEEIAEVNTDEETLTNATNHLNLLVPLLEVKEGKNVVDDEALLRKQFETQEVQQENDLNTEEVQMRIEDKLEELRERGVINVQADHLRGQMRALVDSASKEKQVILDKREAVKAEELKQSNGLLQDELINFVNAETFYGVNMTKKEVGEVYQKVVSGEFIKNLQSDKKAMAELALMAAFKESIFKNATSKTYSDGLKAMVNEFKSQPKANNIAKAQIKGSQGSSEGSKGLIAQLLYDSPDKE